MQLQKLTTRYIEDEDRFLVSAESDCGVVNMWFTQRILKLLVPHVLGWIDRCCDQTCAAESEPASKHGDVNQFEPGDDLSRTKRQKTSQLLAQSRKTVPQVEACRAQQSCLIKSVQLQPRESVLRLVFSLPDADASLLLQEEHARIWIGVLYQAWKKAEWEDIWPVWVKQSHGMRQQYPVSQIH